MLVALIVGIILLGYLDEAARLGRLRNGMLKLRYEWFELRDNLRNLVIFDGREYNKHLQFLDTSITKLVTIAPGLTIFEMAFVIVAHRRESTGGYDDLMKYINNPVNKKFRHFFEHNFSLFRKLLLLRHPTLRWAASKIPNDRKDQGIKIVTTAPEFTTFRKYFGGIKRSHA